MFRSPRTASRRTQRRMIAALLAFSTILSPLFSLPVVQAENRRPAASAARTAAVKARAAQLTAHPHRAGELLVRFRQNATAEAREQFVSVYGKGFRKLRGRGGQGGFPGLPAPTGSEAATAGSGRLLLKDGQSVSSALPELMQMDGLIEWVEPNYLVAQSGLTTQGNNPPNDPQYGAQWALENTGQNGGAFGADIRAAQGWQRTKGSRQTIIAVIDTGIDAAHPDLKDNLWRNRAEEHGRAGEDDDRNGYTDDAAGWNFVSDNNNVSDDHGHGTAMAGIIAAEGGNHTGITGVMWEARLLPLKALDSTGSGAVSDVVEAMDYAVAQGAGVINCSFGTEAESVALREAISRAATAGALVVASAGNNSRDLASAPQYPAGYNLNNLLAVAATTSQDTLAPFSNWSGTSVQLAAPGENILTTQRGGGYAAVSGTSAAAPLVAGVAGLIRTLRDWSSAQAVRQALLAGVRQVPALSGLVASGGVVSAGDAIASFISSSGGSGNGNGGGNGGGSGGNGGGNGGSQGGGGTGGINIDYMRAHTPNRPEPRVMINNLPDPTYDDPGAGSGNGSYFTTEAKPQNSVGPAGEKPGEPVDPTGSDSTVGAQSVNPGSQNFNFTLPVVSLAGRAGHGLSLALSYNSKVWMKDPVTNKMVYNADKGFPAPGWRIGFGAIQGVNASGAMSAYTSGTTGRQTFLYLEPDGTRRELAYNATTRKYESYDSSWIDFTDSTNGTNRILRLSNGTQITFGDHYDYQYLPTVIKDRNGNLINVTYQTLSNGERVINYVKDTLGRVIEFYYESNRLTKIRQNRGGTYYDFITISWAPVTFTTNFNVTTDPVLVNGTTVVWQPWFIQEPTGMNTRFFYTSYGQLYEIERWAPTITGQGGERCMARTRYNLPSYNGYSAPAGAIGQPMSNTAQFTDAPAFTARVEWAENWNLNTSGVAQEAVYSYFFDPAGTFSTVTDPQDRVYRTDTNTSGTTQTLTSKVYASTASYNNGSGTPLKTITTTLTQDQVINGSYSYYASARPTDLQITDGTFTKRTVISYVTSNGVTLPSDTDEYNGASVYRRTHTDYLWDAACVSRHIFGLPQYVKVYSGPGTTLLAQSLYTYDESYLFLAASGDGAIQHDDTNYGDGFITGRGNLTTVSQYNVSTGAWRTLGMRTKYDTYGCARTLYDPENRATSLGTWDNFSNKPTGTGETHALTTQVTDADSYSNGAKYDYYTGLPLQTYHLSGTTPVNVTTYSYTTGDRPDRVTRPDGGYNAWSYWDNWRAVGAYLLIDTGKERYSFTAFDGAGHVRWQGSDHPNATPGWYSVQRYFYDSVNRTTDVSNATAADGGLSPLDGEAWYYTTFEYDALDRQTKVYRQDHTGSFSSYVQYDYTGCGCAGSQTVTVTDERGKKRKTVSDFLGRLLEAHDLTAAGATYSKALYSYSPLDQLTTIAHYNNSTAHQDRTFAYDGWGRLQSETTPEAGTMSYTYTPDDRISTVTDARSITASFGYNNRRLLTSVQYNDADATPDVYYSYGEYGERLWMDERTDAGTVLGRSTYAYTPELKLQSETRQFTSSGIMNSGTYKLDYTWNLAGGLNRMTVTVNGFVKNINYGWNSAGAPTGVGTNLIGTNPDTTSNVIGGLQYAGFGGVKTLNYGANPRKLDVTWDLKRQQMSRQQVRRSDNSDPVIDLSYDYYNAGKNNGRIQKITDNLDAAYTVTYGYDHLNRLSTASATAYTRTYTYDEWANLRTVTATGAGETGGYSLSYASNASGAPATNRISTYSYDAAGNVTNDGGTYAYDAASRMKTAGGTNYGFDGDGRRVRVQQGGYSSIYYFWSSVLGQPVAEIVGDTGAIFQAYVYNAGGQMLALLSNDGTFYWSHQDHLGSGRKLTDSTGAVRYRGEFDPHGQTLLEVTAGGTGTYANSHKYTGYEREWSTNLDYAQARMYSHNRARFMQPDPLGVGAADLSSPQTLNSYSYVANDPVSFTDPSGLHVIDPDYWEKNQPSLHGTGLFSPGIHLLGYTNSEGYFNLTGVVVWGGVWGSLGGQTVGSDGGRQKKATEKTNKEKLMECLNNVDKNLEAARAKAMDNWKSRYLKAAAFGAIGGGGKEVYYQKVRGIEPKFVGKPVTPVGGFLISLVAGAVMGAALEGLKDLVEDQKLTNQASDARDYCWAKYKRGFWNPWTGRTDEFPGNPTPFNQGYP